MSHFVSKAIELMNAELKRIEVSIHRLTDDKIWYRFRNNTNSIGNLCMHLAGNEYQNIISGIGGRPFIRERSLEFQLKDGMNGEELIQHLRNVRRQSEEILKLLTEEDLQREITIHYSLEDWNRMKERETASSGIHSVPSIQSLLFHVVEHYGYHAGQIVLIAKILQEGEQNITEFKH